ncbi:MAG: phage portal protein [Hyphomicrobium sp.]|nr:phage portal protein [Hyphomicrobium sp.]
MGLIDRARAVLGSALGFKAAVAEPVSGRPAPVYGLFAGMSGDITPQQAWALYKSVGTFAKVVDLIADQVAALVPVAKVDGEIVDGHAAALLLAKPGFNRDRRRLVKEIAVQVLTTGTAYVHVVGNVRRMPLSLDVLPTRHATVIEGTDGWPDQVMLNEPRRTLRFAREMVRADFRWLDGLVGEIVPVYDIAGDIKGVGLSRLQAVRADVELKMQGLVHNRSLMQKGARLGGVLSFKNALTPDQREQIMADFRDSAQGARNAGGVLITGGGEADFTSMMMTPRDMDWGALVKAVDEAIVARYNVPTTLFAVEAQTFNNYEAAWRAFYDNAVLPTFAIVYGALARTLSHRLGEEIELVHDELTANVLAKQAIEKADSLLSGGMITKNEARMIVGYEPMAGGDNILDMPGLVPTYTDLFTGFGDDAAPNRAGAGEDRDDDDAAGDPPPKAPARAALN